MTEIIWRDTSEKLPEGDYLLVILTDTDEYVLRPRGWLHREEDGTLRTVGAYGRGYEVKKFAIIPFVDSYEQVTKVRGEK